MNKENNTKKMAGKDNPPVKPEKDIPMKPDRNPDPTTPKPGGNDPQKNDPTRIEEPHKLDPTRIEPSTPYKR